MNLKIAKRFPKDVSIAVEWHRGFMLLKNLLLFLVGLSVKNLDNQVITSVVAYKVAKLSLIHLGMWMGLIFALFNKRLGLYNRARSAVILLYLIILMPYIQVIIFMKNTNRWYHYLYWTGIFALTPIEFLYSFNVAKKLGPISFKEFSKITTVPLLIEANKRRQSLLYSRIILFLICFLCIAKTIIIQVIVGNDSAKKVTASEFIVSRGTFFCSVNALDSVLQCLR